ncbi:hypothetical protein [Luteimonas sp. e5]
MKPFSLILISIILLAQATAAARAGDLFVANSKEQGADFDLTATEVERLPTKSYLSIPNFHERTAPGSRWLMCVYTELAMERGFEYWFVQYPRGEDTRVIVGFADSNATTADEAIGSDFNSEALLNPTPSPVRLWAALCGL